jgi:anti-sigma B factor antagonist
MEFQIQTSTGGRVAVTALKGRLDAANCRQLRQAFDTCLGTTNKFVIDCRLLDFIDSSGLGTLVACLRKALAASGDICLAGVGPRVRMVFELTQAVKLFSFFSTTEQALASLDGQPA